MKVLLCARGDYLKNTAGDTIILLKIYSYLKSLEVNVDIACSDDDYDYTSYDIVHLFDIKSIFNSYKHLKGANASKGKIVVSPLYFDMSSFYKHIGDMDRLKLWNNCKIYREEVLNKSKLIICNSEYEKDSLIKDFNVGGKSKVIHNGVDLQHEDVPLYNFKERYNLDKYVVSVGRICASKNQFTLSKICHELGIPLVLIGPVAEKEYLRKCLQFNNVKYLGFMDDYNVYNAYKFARVHVLPSFAEVTSLSSLEAAASGTNIVVTEEGASKEYFKDMGIYCNPYDEVSIKEAILRGYGRRKNNKLKEYIGKSFSWENTVKSIYESYLEL